MKVINYFVAVFGRSNSCNLYIHYIKASVVCDPLLEFLILQLVVAVPTLLYYIASFVDELAIYQCMKKKNFLFLFPV